MADWQTVRFDPAYIEPLDPEIIPLCDALNAAGFVTVASCCGHGKDWPRVWFAHSADERIESMARFVKATEQVDYAPSFSLFQREVLWPSGYTWMMELHLNNVYRDTPTSAGLKEATRAINRVTALVNEWSRLDPSHDR